MALLHETEHAIHISGVATRPAFANWPDSDPFTEALGDLLAMEAYELEWQERYLGAGGGVDDWSSVNRARRLAKSRSFRPNH